MENILKQLKIGDLLPKYPIIQGGIGVGISLSGLAGAVAAAGGIGVISTAGIGLLANRKPITIEMED
ncbi:MAG: nitronate monooxygenase, partial [bacterium]|nr:nitronate monooxygenase [bacterium]